MAHKATIPLRRALAIAVAIAWHAELAHALPTGGQVAAGSASIAKPGTQSLQINQTSQNAIVNWQTFSIAAPESVVFVQPSSSSITLNRVLGSNPSEIYGRLSANGQIFLTNPNGIIFGRGASVDVGGLVASSLSISDADFLAGKYVFQSSAPVGNPGEVVNQGTITAIGGYAALVAPRVSNEGIINARLGTVALASGGKVELDLIGDGLINVVVSQSAVNAAALNSGMLQADGGNVLITARSATDLLATVINTDGVVRANSIAQRGGVIVLDGGNAGITNVAGAVAASGANPGSVGGTVKVLGEYVSISSGAHIDSTGYAGGGTVLIGGNFHGTGPERNASRTFVATDANIDASALHDGAGGKVAIWSNDGTQFYGSASARGGAAAGNGGLVEVSGRNYLDFRGAVDTRGPAGETGTLLLDPDTATIDNTANSNVSNNVGTFTATVAGNPFNVTWATINAQLATTNTVVQTSSGDITVTQAGTLTNARTLTLNSVGNVNLGPGFTTPGALNITAGGTVTQTGPVVVGGSTAIFTPTTLALNQPANDFIGPVTLTTGLAQIADANALTLGAVNTAGALTVSTFGALNLGTGSVAGSLVATSGNGNVSQTGPLVVSGGVNINAGTGSIALAGLTAVAGGAVTLTAGGSLIPGAIDAGVGVLNILAGSISTAGSLTGFNATLGSNSAVGTGATPLAINFGAGNVVLVGAATDWNLRGPTIPQPTFTPLGQSTGANVFYNGACISGPACAGVFTVTTSFGATIASVLSSALNPPLPKEPATNPPLDLAVEGGLRVPKCFEESKEGGACVAAGDTREGSDRIVARADRNAKFDASPQ